MNVLSNSILIVSQKIKQKIRAHESFTNQFIILNDFYAEKIMKWSVQLYLGFKLVRSNLCILCWIKPIEFNSHFLGRWSFLISWSSQFHVFLSFRHFTLSRNWHLINSSKSKKCKLGTRKWRPGQVRQSLHTFNLKYALQEKSF